MHRYIAVCVIMTSGALCVVSSAARPDDVYQGRIAAGSKGSISIIDNQGENLTFIFSADCKITRDGKPSEAAMLGIGDRVQIRAKDDAGKLVATTISSFSAAGVAGSRTYASIR